MLYKKIRYAEAIRKLYRLRHVLARKKHPGISSRLGYTKYGKQYYDVIKKLENEKVLDEHGHFIETVTNVWLSELPIIVKKKEKIRTLGYQTPYNIFLASVFSPRISLFEITEYTQMKKRSVYSAVNQLKKVGLVKFKNSIVSQEENEPMFFWLYKYLRLCIDLADTKQDISVLFDSVPAYIDGPTAYYLLNYEPGRPIGPSDMIIRTSRPYSGFWKSVLEEIRYFKNYPKKIELAPANPDDQIVWMNGLPYNKKAKLRTRI